MFSFARFAEGLDAEAQTILSLAYRRACIGLGIAPETSGFCEHDASRLIMADTIVQASRAGVRDPATLKLHALAAVARGRQAIGDDEFPGSANGRLLRRKA
jgi:hypothetical protein